MSTKPPCLGWRRILGLMLEGAQSITFFPQPIPRSRLKLGSVADDWRAVGKDLRSAMNQLDAERKKTSR